MQFFDVLNRYIDQIDITAKELADESGLGTSTISRYRKGERIPQDIETVQKLARAICVYANKHEINNLDENVVYEELLSQTNIQQVEGFAERFSLIIDTLEINSAKLAGYMNYDPSLISRIKMNKRKPNEFGLFVDKFVMYLVSFYSSEKDKRNLMTTLCFDEATCDKCLTDTACYVSEIKRWLLGEDKHINNNSSLLGNGVNPSSYLSKLDEFNLDDYIEMIHFNDIKIPTVPFQLTSSKTYIGIKEMRNGEIDFIKSTVLSKSNEPLTMCSDMPMEDMAEDKEFAKRWMFGLAAVLKKGLTINIVHNLDRPFKELMLGLESWIPLYMTGLVQPYYLSKPQNEVYGHLHYSSGEVALAGECVMGHHNQGKYYLTRKKEEVEFYKNYTNHILDKALPLMKIYTSNNCKDLYNFIFDERNYGDSIIHRYTVPPIYTMSEELLKEILKRNKLDTKQEKQILEFRRKELESFDKIIRDKSVTDKFYSYSEDEFKDGQIVLNVSEAFCDKEIVYTFEDYEKHLSEITKFKKKYENYEFIKSETRDFKSIQFTIAKGKWVLVMKDTHPNIGFLIMHPILREAIENMKLIFRD